MKTLEQFMFECGFTWDDFDKPSQIKSIIEMYGEYVRRCGDNQSASDDYSICKTADGLGEKFLSDMGQ